MFFLLLYVLAIVSAALRLQLRLSGARAPRRVAEVMLQHLLVCGYGLGGVFAFIGHQFRADEVVRSIGNPFQTEIAWANLGGGLTGLLCARSADPGFWTATTVANSVFYVGAAVTHIRELRRSCNTAINNAGAILPDLLTPRTVLSLVWVHPQAARERQPDRLLSTRRR